jgi:hypothetical protein
VSRLPEISTEKLTSRSRGIYFIVDSVIVVDTSEIRLTRRSMLRKDGDSRSTLYRFH